MTQFDPRGINHLEESYAELEGALVFYRIAQEKVRGGVATQGDLDIARAGVRGAILNVRKERFALTHWGARALARLDWMLGDPAETALFKRRMARLGWRD